EIGREADEPRIFLVIGGAGLAGDRLTYLLDNSCRAALHDAFHHRGDLVGRHWIEHALALVDQCRLVLVLPLFGLAAAALARVVLVDSPAVAVLDAVDQSRLDLSAAVVEHGVRADHAKQRGLTRAKRKREVWRQTVIDPEAPRRFAGQRHSDAP